METTISELSSIDTKMIILGGIPTYFEGDPNDPYFRTLEASAADINLMGDFVSQHVSPEATVIDAGANIGLSVITLARLVKRVIAFEPSPPNAAFLRRNLALNQISNVEVVAAAASSEPATLQFHVAQFGAGSHVVSSGDLSREGLPMIDVPAVPLDQFDFPPVSFIKIDVEGHEPEVLAGARRLLARDRPLIFMEVNIWCLTAYGDHSPSAFVRTLWEKFEVWAPAPEGQMLPLPSGLAFLHETICQKGGFGDIILQPRQGMPMAALAELSWPEAAVSALGSLAAH